MLMLLAVPGSFRLAGTVEPGRGEAAFGFYTVVALSLALGLAPDAVLALNEERGRLSLGRLTHAALEDAVNLLLAACE